MMTDPIADFLTRIRNGQRARKHQVTVPFSRLKKRLADILVRTGYLAAAEESRAPRPELMLTLKYEEGAPAATHLARVSKPGSRRYVKRAALRPVLQGRGLAIISTPRGLLTDREARELGVGGEVLCEIY